MKKERRYRVLIVDNSPGLTGAYKSISSITSALSDEFDFTFCLLKGSALLERSKKLRPTFGLSFLEIGRQLRIVFYLPMLFLNSLRLLFFIRKNNIDVLHMNDLYNMTGIVVKKIYPRIKLVYHVRLLPSSYAGRLYWFWLSRIISNADQIVCVSYAVKKCIPASDKITVIYDAIEFKEAPSDHPRKSENETVSLLYFANYIEGKGHDYAIKAFECALRENGSLRLLMAGGDLGLKKNRRYKEGLIALAKALNVADKVTFEGSIEDTRSVLAQADIFLNFSQSESFSLTCLEALLHGTPLIATDSGGPAELFEPGISGLLVPVGDIAAMSGAILKLSLDPLLRERMGANAKKHAHWKFGHGESAGKLKEVYFTALMN